MRPGCYGQVHPARLSFLSRRADPEAVVGHRALSPVEAVAIGLDGTEVVGEVGREA